MAELLVMLAAILVGGMGLVIWLNAREEWLERDRLERFQDAMRAGSCDPSSFDKREE
jgi:hypothetical protein